MGLYSQTRADWKQDLRGAGSYTITTKIPNPVAEAVCVNANKTELEPIVYESWPYAIRANDSRDRANIEKLWPDLAFGEGSSITSDNHTVLDEIFGWQNESRGDRRPSEYTPEQR